MYRELLTSFIFLLFFFASAKAQSNSEADTSYIRKEKDTIQFTEYEKNALRLIDSIQKIEQQEKELKQIELITTKNLTTKYFYIPLKHLIDFNYYEGLRLGFGLITTNNISEHFSLGGYFGYGFKDQAWKYGGDLILNLHKKSESKIHFLYSNDVIEKSGYQFLEVMDLSSSEIFRKYMIENMDIEEKYQIQFNITLFNYLTCNIFINQSYISATDNYTFGSDITNSANTFTFSEVGFQFRYTHNEQFRYVLDKKYSLGTKYPVLYGNLIKGTHWFNGEFEYTKYEAKISKVFKTETLGKTLISLVGGLADKNIPISKLYNGHGSYQTFSIESENSFGTMRMGEFYSDRFFSIFFKHSFGHLFKTQYFSPKIAVVNNYGIASLSEKQNHFAPKEIKSYDKGYYECGILINNILNQSFFGYGIGVFYRYGPYAFSKTADNFSYKLSLSIGL